MNDEICHSVECYTIMKKNDSISFLCNSIHQGILGGPVVGICASNDTGSVPGRRTGFPHATWHSQKKKKEKIKLKNIHQTPKFYSVGKASCGKACVCKMPHSVFA